MDVAIKIAAGGPRGRATACAVADQRVIRHPRRGMTSFSSLAAISIARHISYRAGICGLWHMAIRQNYGLVSVAVTFIAICVRRDYRRSDFNRQASALSGDRIASSYCPPLHFQV